MSYLSIKGLTINYGNVLAINNVDIEVEKGETITIIGANGAGKSSILMAISGVVKPSKGKIIFEGEEIQRYSPKLIASMGIVQVPEGRRIFPHLTVQENLDLGAFLRKDKHELKDDMDYVYELFPILKDRANQTGGTLSGGEQQMLAIGRSLMQNPKLLCFDEPSLGLAPIIIQRIFEDFKKLKKDRNITLLLVEQNVNLALKNSDRAYVLETGNIAITGDSKNLQKDKKIKSVYLGGHAE